MPPSGAGALPPEHFADSLYSMENTAKHTSVLCNSIIMVSTVPSVAGVPGTESIRFNSRI